MSGVASSGARPGATPGLDVAVFGRWLAAAHPELIASDGGDGLTATRLAGGLSNLTYRIDGAARPLVLRRPPLGHVLSTAHDMQREFTIISALAGSAVAVPAALVCVDDADGEAGVGTPFYLMDFVAGPILSRTTVSAVESAFNTLAHTVLSNNARTLEDLVKEMLRPMLKSWLDDNLPGLVERLVRAEIERVSRGRA